MTVATDSRSTVIPALRYRDAHAAIEWLKRAFGFTVQALHEGPGNTVAHAQLVLSNSCGRGMIMLGSAVNEGEWAKQMVLPSAVGSRSTASIALIVPDATEMYASALAAGAEIFMKLEEMPYGGKAFGCKDPEGHVWSIGEYDPWAHSLAAAG